MLLRVMRALALSTFSLAALALIVDARAERSLPDGFPFLAGLRDLGDVLERLGGPEPTPSREAERMTRPPEGVLSTASAMPREIIPSALPADVVPVEGTGPGLPSGPSGVRVNRGLP